MPGTCQFTIDVRYPSKFSSRDVSSEVQAAANRLRNSPDFPKTTIEIGDSTPPFEASKSSPITRALGRAIIQTRKVKPTYLHKTGTGDMNILGSALNIPVVTYGPGNPHLSHTSKECLEVEEYLASIKIYIQTIKNLKSMIKE
jgi:LysW-gamma-L-lysine carboxypeptidase